MSEIKARLMIDDDFWRELFDVCRETFGACHEKCGLSRECIADCIAETIRKNNGFCTPRG